MSLFTPNISFNDFYEKGRFLLAWRISVVFSFLFFILSFIYLLIDPSAAILLSVTFVISLSAVIYLKFSKKYKPLFWVYSISGTIMIHFAMNTIMNFTHYVDFLWVIGVILLSFIGLGLSYGILFAIINTLGLAYFYLFTVNSHIETMQARPMPILIGELIEVVFALFVIIYLLRQFVVFQNQAQKELKIAYSNLEEQNTLILAKSKENETLIKEIHHRIKNNLQIIISLLRMQSNEMKSKDAKEHFKEAINRVMTMSLIHQKLYTEKDFSSINIKSYFDDLVKEIVYSSSENQIDVKIKSNVSSIDLDTIVPLGLIVNELVSNSLKHAFNPSDKKIIFIEINESPEKYNMVYQDNGIWKGKTKKISSFGLELIDILTEQLNGEKTLDTANGTKYTFIFKRDN